MPLSNRVWFRVVNDFLHDMAAGLGPGAVLALRIVSDHARATLAPEVFADLVRSWSWVVLVLFLALVVLLITGAVRLNYRTLGVRDDALAAKGRMALIKHAAFVLLFVAAVVEAFILLNP